MKKYLELLEKLISIRSTNNGRESLEEDTLLEEMDREWLNLSEEEKNEIQKIKSRSEIIC